MTWSPTVGRLAGVPVRLHVTFLLLVAFIGTAHWMAGGLAALATGLLVIGGLFGSVLLHEIGHALAARRFGIPTRDIVLLPMGGVARLERMPEKPAQEIVVALAGPAVNVAIAGVLFAWLAVSGQLQPLGAIGTTAGPVAERLMVANVGLLLFNLLPVFPLDGGRVLRAALAMRLPYVRATRLAGRIGRAGAAVLGLYGVLANHPMLALVAVFIWVAARAETAAAEARQTHGADRVLVPEAIANHEAAVPVIVLRSGPAPSTRPGAGPVVAVVTVAPTRRVVRTPAVVLLVALAAVLLTPSRSAAQYFGQNKVRAKAVEFKVLETEHFDIHYYDEKRQAAIDAGRMLERWYARLSSVFGAPLSSRQAVVLYASHADFRGTTVVPDEIGETTGGLTEAARRRIVMPLAGPLADTDHVLGHELVHAFQYDMANRLKKAGVSTGQALSLPLWFIEGMAEYLSVGPVDAQTAMWLRDAVARGNLPAVRALDDPRYFPYRWGHAFWAYVTDRHGDRVIEPLLAAAMAAGDVEEALQAVLKTNGEALSRDWHSHLAERFAPAPRKRASISLRPLLPDAKGRVNLGPAVSPDGTLVAFFSERDQAAVDLFVASTADGRIRHKLTEMAVDPHTDSYRFVNSAGAWSPDGRGLAFGSIAKGRAQLTIMDVEDRRVRRTVPLEGIGEVLAASWSPDGQALVLSAIAGGYVDLFLVRLGEGTVSRLTSDPYAELHPAWSPDGRSIAYVTDRFTSNLETLQFGELRLARFDLGTRSSELLRAFETGRHLSPHWSADGRTLWFVADHDGVANVCRLWLDDGRVEPVTAETIGVTGIGETSPALSVAANGTFVVSLFEGGAYRLHVGQLGHGAAVAAAGDAARQEPHDVVWTAGLQRKLTAAHAREDGRDAPHGTTAPAGSPAADEPRVPDAAAFRVRDYRPRLSAEGFMPLQAGLSLGEVGPFMTGGIAVSFGDIVGQHRLTLGFNGNTLGGGTRLLDNLSFITVYQNQRGLWTWGAAGGQTSSAFSGALPGFGLVQGQPARLQREVTTWEIAREGAMRFSRALSRSRRVELAGGYQNMSFRAESRTQATSALTGLDLGEERADLPTPTSLNLATGHAALVHDTSVFGGTSPVMGERYRLQVGAVAGSVRYVTLLADYRRYVPIGGPFSVAGRAMHVGRYGAGAEDSRLQPLFVGYSHLVRGFDNDAYPYASCQGGVAVDGCRSGQQLFGSRIAVANLELRTSISGYKGLLPALTVPVEAAVFVDAGVPWSSRRAREAFDRPVRVAASTGISLRVNLFGSAVGQVSYVRSNDRAIGWRWEFSLTPGF